jgi:predicted MFS family arabinose efflux permease
MFLIEGLFAVAVGVAVFLFLRDGPSQAPWLSNTEKQLLLKTLSSEKAERTARGPSSPLQLLRSPCVLYFSVTYFLIQAGVYGVIFYLPGEVASILGREVGPAVGLVSAIPWISAILATAWLSRLADRYSVHRLLASLGLLASGCAILVVPVSEAGVALLALCVAASGYIAVQPLFWTFPTEYLSGASAAAGIAMINSFGNIGGFVAPNIKVAAEAHLRSSLGGPISLASITFLGSLLLAFMRNRRLDPIPPGVPF